MVGLVGTDDEEARAEADPSQAQTRRPSPGPRTAHNTIQYVWQVSRRPRSGPRWKWRRGGQGPEAKSLKPGLVWPTRGTDDDVPDRAPDKGSDDEVDLTSRKDDVLKHDGQRYGTMMLDKGQKKTMKKGGRKKEGREGASRRQARAEVRTVRATRFRVRKEVKWTVPDDRYRKEEDRRSPAGPSQV